MIHYSHLMKSLQTVQLLSSLSNLCRVIRTDFGMGGQSPPHRGGGHSGLWWDTSWKLVCLYPMPHYARGCRISTLIMVPINFWRNSDLFKKKERFSSLKIDKVRSSQRKSLKFFQRKSLKFFQRKYLKYEHQLRYTQNCLKFPGE